MATSATLEKRAGLAYWMEEVLVQCGKAEHDFSADPVHDLRTALRRCRSMAEGIRVFDCDSAWKKMRRAGKQLFSSLGDLRDTHIMIEWVQTLAPDGDAASTKLTEFLLAQQRELKENAAAVLEHFDRRLWKNWASKLPARANRIPLDSPVLAHLALERWIVAHTLHVQALRNRTNVAFHELRIGIKRFRYTLENFLPSLYERWGKDLKNLQDLLGDVHDLDVLWQTAIRLNVFSDASERRAWRERIKLERHQRLSTYRAKMVGKNSLWSNWRAGLPADSELPVLGLERLRIWASFLDPRTSHARHVSRLTLQLYDELPAKGLLRSTQRDSYRLVLHASALLHEVGRAKANSGHHKISARLVRKLIPPLGWNKSELELVAAIIRYHRGALPQNTQKRFATLSNARQRLVQLLGGILRLACACDWQQDGKISRVSVESLDPVITVRAEGYVESTPLADHIAAARHLLELTYGRPVFVVANDKPQAQAA